MPNNRNELVDAFNQETQFNHEYFRNLSLKKAVKTFELNYMKKIIDTDKWFIDTKHSDLKLWNIALQCDNKDASDFLIKRGFAIEKSNQDALILNHYNDEIRKRLLQLSLMKLEDYGDENLVLWSFKQKLFFVAGQMLPFIQDNYFMDLHGLSNLHIMCSTNNLLELAEYLFNRSKININVKVSDDSPHWPGWTSLHFAVQSSSPKLIKWLISKGADVNIANANGLRPLHLAFRKRKTILSRILATHPDIKKSNYVDQHGLSYFHIASARRLKTLMKALLEDKENVDVNSQVYSSHPIYSGYTALHFAAKIGNFKFVYELVDNGADFNIQNSHGCTPLHLAFYGKQERIVKWILGRMRYFTENPTDRDGLSHFHIAAMYTKNAIEGFINIGRVDVNAKVHNNAKMCAGWTALHIAADTKRASVTELLLVNGADPNATERRGMTPLHFVCRTSEYKTIVLKAHARKECISEAYSFVGLTSQVETFEHLVNYGADVHMRDKNGRTPLLHLYDHAADTVLAQHVLPDTEEALSCVENIVRERNKILAELLHAGANINAADSKGVTLLHQLVDCVIFQRSIHIAVKTLIERKFLKVNVITKDGMTPLAIAAKSKETMDMAELLLECGADANVILDENLTTPFHIHANYFIESLSRSSVFKHFVEFGGNVNQKLKNGKNVLHVLFSRTDGLEPFYTDKRWTAHKSDEMIVLLDLTSDINIKDSLGFTPLHYACMRDDRFEVEMLLDHGADIDVFDRDGFSPLHYCLKDNTTETRDHCKKVSDVIVSLYSYVDRIRRIGCYLDENNVAAFELLRNSHECQIDNQRRMREIEREQQELEGLGKINVDELTSLQDLLFKSPSELIHYITTEGSQFRDIISCDEFEQEFPLLGCILKRQYRKGLRSAQLLRPAEESRKRKFDCLDGNSKS